MGTSRYDDRTRRDEAADRRDEAIERARRVVDLVLERLEVLDRYAGATADFGAMLYEDEDAARAARAELEAVLAILRPAVRSGAALDKLADADALVRAPFVSDAVLTAEAAAAWCVVNGSPTPAALAVVVRACILAKHWPAEAAGTVGALGPGFVPPELPERDADVEALVEAFLRERQAPSRKAAVGLLADVADCSTRTVESRLRKHGAPPPKPDDVAELAAAFGSLLA